nr:hypothetical protein [Candidatus Litorirhabdus singularis]
MARQTGEDFINVEGIAIARVLSFQAAGINSAELDAPKTDRFAADGDTAFSEKVFDVPVTVTTRLRLKR